ncbi:hypothetical protein [Apibacter adventoris]|uniref:hypothetical protein n=1 Tax=Apibacter adventoris TaxID=1679466 RepID=UPI0015E3D3A9|nr:hypothetical protein [Apibacter adventoris]
MRDSYSNDKLRKEAYIIDKERNSLYFNKNEDNYPDNPPQKIETKNAFNYNSIKKDV